MKNIKQILLIAGVLLYTTAASAQDNEISFFNSGSQNENSKAAGPGFGGTNEPDPETTAPIDDYLPLLVVGAGLVALRFRKQLLKK